MPMDLYEAIKIRRSIRSYKPAPVEPEKLARIQQLLERPGEVKNGND